MGIDCSCVDAVAGRSVVRPRSVDNDHVGYWVSPRRTVATAVGHMWCRLTRIATVAMMRQQRLHLDRSFCLRRWPNLYLICRPLPAAATAQATPGTCLISCRNGFLPLTVKPRPHQQQCRSSRQHCRSYVRLCRTNVRLCCHKRQQCRTKFRPFDKVETNWTCSICFDFVERIRNFVLIQIKLKCGMIEYTICSLSHTDSGMAV